MHALQDTAPLSEQDLVDTALALIAGRRVKLVGIFRDKSPTDFARTIKPVV
jgi:hypothetical protein